MRYIVLFGLVGCTASSSDDAPTYHGDVAPLMAQHCVSCHSEDNIAPFVLTRYEPARQMAPFIKTAVETRTMPPFHVDDSGACQSFQGARLSDDDIETIAAWVDAGAPEGEPAEEPLEAPEHPTLDNVSSTLDPGIEYTPNPALADDYRCFIVDPMIDTDQFLTGFEVHPGEPSQVHHVVLFSVDTAAELAVAHELDDAEEGPGYTCFGASGTGPAARSLGVWTPGTPATRYPEGTGLRVVGGMPLVMQVHYNNGKLPDRTTVLLSLEPSVAREALITGVFDLQLDLVPGNAAVEESAAAPVPPLAVPVTIHGAYPHMHKLGRSLRVEYDLGGERTCLVNVPRYDFNWQQFYFYDKPVLLEPPGGGYLRITCSYDTRGVDAPVHWGEGTNEEMCINAFYVTY
jgi:copper type II ascorbate-dependent monooxygenase-like protein